LLSVKICSQHDVENHSACSVSAAGWSTGTGRPFIWSQIMRPGVHPGCHLHLRRLSVEALLDKHSFTTITYNSISYFTDEILDLFSSYDSNAPDSAAPSSQHDPDSNLPSLAQGEQEGGVFSRPVRSLISQEVLEALRTVDRKGRDVVVGLSNACCKWGCSKGEISSLC
ncbi:hypothetical protein cypCar_00016646, partial [Cyprinus carpio]